MSWNVSKVGASDKVAETVTADPNLPQPIKDLVAAFAKANKGLHIVSSGHLDTDATQGSWSTCQLTINPVDPV